MVFEQHSVKGLERKKEEVKTSLLQTKESDMNEIIDNQNIVESNDTFSDLNSVLKNEVNEILFKDYPNIDTLLEETSVLIMKKIVSNIDENQKYFQLVTGTKLKKIRTLLITSGKDFDIDTFDKNLKEMVIQIINEIHNRKTDWLNKKEMNNYLKFFNIIQNLMKELHIYSNWAPVGYENSSIITEFDNLWKEITQKEIPELPKFFNAIISFIESNLNDKSDSEKDKYLSSLMKIYAFLNPNQKKEFLIEYWGELSLSLENFIGNFLSLPKDKTNMLIKQMWVLDMILDHASGGASLGALSLKNMLNQKIDNQIKNQQFEEGLRELFGNQPNSDKDESKESESSNDKVEELRKMFESVLIQPVNIKELSSQIILFENIYNLMHNGSAVLPLFLFKTSEVDHNQARFNANLILHLSNIVKCQASKEFGIGATMNEFEVSLDLPLNLLLLNLDEMSEDSTHETIHQNVYREMLVLAIENKILQAHKLLTEPNSKKSIKYYLVGKVDDGWFNSGVENDEEKIETKEEKLTFEELDLDISESLNIITNKIEGLMAHASNLWKIIFRHILKESRWYSEITEEEEETLVDIAINFSSIENDENLTRAGTKILFDGDNMSSLSNKKNDCSIFLNTMIQILNPGFLSNEYNQIANKSKIQGAFDVSKIKALWRRTLVNHYWPFLYLIKDLKLKQEYLSNSCINTDILYEIINLCSLQRLIYSYLNLNVSFLLLIKQKINQVDGVVISRQMNMLRDVLENPIARFLNHSNLGNKCQNIFNSYVRILALLTKIKISLFILTFIGISDEPRDVSC